MFRPSPKPNLTDTYMCHSIVIKSKLTDTKIERQKKQKNKITLLLLSNAGPPDRKYLYYPHVEGVTRKGSLLPASMI